MAIPRRQKLLHRRQVRQTHSRKTSAAAIEALDKGLLNVQEGKLNPDAYSAMCRGAKAMPDLYRLADQEMELIRHEETEAAAMEVVGAHGDPAILTAAAKISAEQNQYRLESLIDQGLVTLQPKQNNDADEPPEPVLTDEGRRRLGDQRLTRYTQENIDQLKDVSMRSILNTSQLTGVLGGLSHMRAAIEKALADLARDPAPARDALTGQTLSELPDGVKTGPKPAAQPRQRRAGRENPGGSAPAS